MNFYLLRKQTTNNKQTIIKWIGGEKELKYHQQQQFEITHRERMRKRATEGGGEREGEREMDHISLKLNLCFIRLVIDWLVFIFRSCTSTPV